MLLDSLGELWGKPLDTIKEYGSLRSATNALIVSVGILIVSVIIKIMRSTVITFGEYFTTMIIVMIIGWVFHSLYTKNHSNRVYKFYKKHKSDNVSRITVRVNEEQFGDILYGVTRSSIDNMTCERYISMINETCASIDDCARVIYDCTEKVTNFSTEGTTGGLYDFYFVTNRKGRREYVGFKPVDLPREENI